MDPRAIDLLISLSHPFSLRGQRASPEERDDEVDVVTADAMEKVEGTM